MLSAQKQRHSLTRHKFVNFTVISSFVGLVFLFGIIEVRGGECGSVDVLDPRISGGSATQRGEWPFIAALYYAEKLTFFCGGTLITEQHILTAAHCVQNKDSALKLSADDVIVLLGAYNLSIRERGAIQRDVAYIYVHPDWKVYSDKYDADIAIFVLSKTVQFTNYIRPVCMPPEDVVDHSAKGSIVGWGIADKGKVNLEFPRRAFTYALNASYCFQMDPYLAFLSSTRTFCGSGGDGSPNKGDSGGGFFVLSGSKWVQYGIISALRINASGLVDENSMAIYTNVKTFSVWINEVVRKSGVAAKTEIMTTNQEATVKAEEKETKVAVNNAATMRINLDCYGDNAYFGYVASYSCQIPDLDIQSEHIKVSALNAFHVSGKSDQDVQRIVFFNGTMTYLPDGIGRIFKNLKVFVVLADLNLTFAQRSNFEHLERLIHLHIYRNDIETFAENTLFDLPNLEKFTLYKNKLKVIFGKTFEKNPRLREVDMRWNKLEVLPKDLFENNLLLEEAYFTGNLLNVIQTDFSKLRNLRSLYFNDNVCIDEVSEGNWHDLYRKIEENCRSK